MPEPTPLAIAVPSEDPKKKEKEPVNEEGKPKPKDDKEPEDLVRLANLFENTNTHKGKFFSRRKICSSKMNLKCSWNG